MKEFNQVTKVLKRCWKEKVTITTATVVAFLMGANIYAQDIQDIVPNESGGYEIAEDGNYLINKDISFSKGIISKKAKNISLTNDGIINFKITEDDAKNFKLEGINVEGDSVEIINNGEIIVEKPATSNVLGNGPSGIVAHGSSSVTNAGKVINNKNITVIDNTNTEIKNYGAGMELFKISGINNGNITIKGIGIGVEVNNGTFVNTSSAKIDISGSRESYGILVGKGSKALNEGEILLSFENNNKAIVTKDNGYGVNSGKIIITDKNASDLKEFDLSSVFYGNVVNKGVIEDQKGNIIYQSSDIILGKDLTISDLNKMLSYAPNSSLAVTKDGAVLRGGSKDVSFTSLNIDGNLVMQNILTSPTDSYGISLSNGTINISNNGTITIGNSNNKNDYPNNGKTPTANINLTNVNII